MAPLDSSTISTHQVPWTYCICLSVYVCIMYISYCTVLYCTVRHSLQGMWFVGYHREYKTHLTFLAVVASHL